MVKCIVPNCHSTGYKETIHRFPHKYQLGQLWIKSIGDENLSKISYEELRKQRVGVCKLHFAEDCYLIRTKRPTLKDFSVPTLHMSTHSYPLNESMSTMSDADGLSYEINKSSEKRAFSLKKLEIDTITPRSPCNLSLSSPQIKEISSMIADEEPSPLFQPKAIVQKRSREETSVDVPVCSSPSKKRKTDQLPVVTALKSSLNTNNSAKRKREQNSTEIPIARKKNCSTNLVDSLKKVNQDTVSTKIKSLKRLGSKKNILTFRSDVSNIDMTPRTKKIFESATELRKKLYNKKKALKRYEIDEHSFVQDIEIILKECITFKYVSKEPNVNSEEFDNSEEFNVTMVIEDN